MKRITTAFLILLGTAASAFAGGPTPEIDPASAPAALTLLGGALMILRGRRRR